MNTLNILFKDMAKMLAAAVILSSGAFAATTPPSTLIPKPGLVTTEWLARNLTNSSVRIIDARPGLMSYLQGHIPGAVYLNSESLRLSRGGVPAQVLHPKQLAAVFGSFGISDNSDVVVYGSSEDSFAAPAYVAMLLETLGHPHVGVLDGGFEKWQEEKLPVTKDFPKVSEARFTARLNPALSADAARVEKLVGDSGTVLVDARAPAQACAAHVPGAKNVYIRDVLTTSGKALTWKSADELRKLADDAGITQDKRVVVYCNSGREASQMAFTLRHVLGLQDVAVYYGSMIDWAAKGKPTESTPTTGTMTGK